MLSFREFISSDAAKARLLLLLYAVIMTVLAIVSEGTYGGGDSYLHFQMARYAPRHPWLFMDQWGKPFYTALACLPSQFGFIGIKLFNVACAVTTAWLAFLMARNQFEKLSWLSILFVLSVPIYFVTALTGLTETVFGLCILSSVYLFHRFRERWACVVISFLPFIRSEGFLILPLFALLCIYYRKWPALLFLGTGVVVFTLIGFFYTGSWNWVFGTNVYLTKPTDYGHGSIFHFFENHRYTFGWPYSMLTLLAIVAFAAGYFRQWNNRELHIQSVLVFGSLFIYFMAHSVFWTLGIFGSAGLDRVMAGVGPCIGYTTFCGFQFLARQKFAGYTVTKVILTLWVLWAFIMPRYVYPLPYPLTTFQEMQIEACNYVKENKLDTGFVYFQEPYVPLLLKRDPFDENISGNLYQHGEKPFKPGAIIIWDSHLCSRESLLPLEVMEKHAVTLLKVYSAPDIYDGTRNMEMRIYKAN